MPEPILSVTWTRILPLTGAHGRREVFRINWAVLRDTQIVVVSDTAVENSDTDTFTGVAKAPNCGCIDRGRRYANGTVLLCDLPINRNKLYVTVCFQSAQGVGRDQVDARLHRIKL